MEPPMAGRKKVYINGPDHMTKVASMPIYDKKVLLEKQKSYDHEDLAWSSMYSSSTMII